MPDRPDPPRHDAQRSHAPSGADPGLAARDADEPMSDVQRTTLRMLCREAGQPFDEALSTAGAARRITQLQRAKDRDTEGMRAARGEATTALPSQAGEEDPGAALDAPGTRQAIRGNETQSR